MSERDVEAVEAVARVLFRQSWQLPMSKAASDEIFDSLCDTGRMPFEKQARDILEALRGIEWQADILDV